MYAIVKTGGKQYKVCAGDFLNVEKLDGKVGDKVSLEVIFVSDGGKVVADPKKAAATKVEAEIVEQFKDKKVLVFKFKKRKNYQRKVGHRQQLTRLRVLCVGDEVAKEEKKPAKKTPKKTTKEASDSKAKATPAKKTSTSSAKDEKADKTSEDEKPKKTAAKPKKDSDASAKKEPAKKEAPKDDADDKGAKKEETDAEKAE